MNNNRVEEQKSMNREEDDNTRKSRQHDFSTATVSTRTKKIVSIISILIFFAVMLLIGYFIGQPLVENFGDREKFSKWIEGYGAAGPLVCIGLMMLQIVVAVIPGGVFEIGAGYAFGTWQATLYCTIGSVIASVLIFGFVRLVGVKVVEVLFPLEKLRSLTFLQERRKRNIITFIVFVIPGTPKDMLTYFMGLTEMDMLSYVVISNIARIPAILISTMGGNAVGEENYTTLIIIVLLMIVGTIAGSIYYKKISK